MFDPQAKHAPEVDVSENSRGAVLLQSSPDGIEQAVAYASNVFQMRRDNGALRARN